MTITTQAQIVEMLEQLPDGALDEVKSFLAALQNRYPAKHAPKLSEGMAYIEQVRGKMQCDMTTDEIMALTRGEDD
ncbi:ssr6048 (plasmid) [Synechocystis sp. PCC 6803]|uniref:Ssr6048 protein n=1 Tax=Synechocystis sp. (strain ATCC 27184 / PCC 6803 / Kazusa) TaxID=1111708 RepID=Q6YRV6_SYNY3|nr:MULTISPECIES: hypothetical protein [unclassified Synechocystis]AGF53757.1 hypothetical protein MYO_3490 [Synechocystis sp. PCC 6803]AVP91728.1 hypothetical protein C7I86_18345 [Synechocystis sp. IPPAS B-1465]MBD2620033.1 hypothetical protein [Synechocystis sp. FACHB-898]MBD2638807.1 hypothetical protein [Synechocystis sp. FACHB-908]MBD2662681.1 hypothetical protein [Synechocystis sp. FACHB-929]